MHTVLSFAAFPESKLAYQWDDNYFYVDCSLGCREAVGAKLYINSVNDGTLNTLFLGSLTTDNASVSKSYPLSYLEDGDISPDLVSFFSVCMPDGVMHSSQTAPGFDSSLANAAQVLSSIGGNVDYSREAELCIINITHTLQTLPQAELPVFTEFMWHKIEDIRCTFSLSSIEHIVFDSAFVRAFASSGVWYMACTSSKNIFAVCVVCREDGGNPMSNVSDCVLTADAGGMRYYCVGIGLFDDGQYFCRLKN